MPLFEEFEKNIKKDKICLVGFSEGALISMWSMTQKNDYAAAIVMSPSRQCGMRRAGSKNYCAKNLEKSGKLEKINKKIIITLGKSEGKAHRKTAQNFSKLLNQKAIHKPSAQHVLDDDYYKRIEAIQFTMSHDDGKKVDDINNADIILLGVSRTSKTPTSI